jgi:hypothetical protein
MSTPCSSSAECGTDELPIACEIPMVLHRLVDQMIVNESVALIKRHIASGDQLAEEAE